MRSNIANQARYKASCFNQPGLGWPHLLGQQACSATEGVFMLCGLCLCRSTRGLRLCQRILHGMTTYHAVHTPLSATATVTPQQGGAKKACMAVCLHCK